MERLQKIIQRAGIASRRKAEEIISEGRVSVNGKTITEPGSKANPGDDIRVDGKPIEIENKVYYVMNKPKNVVSTLDDPKGRPAIVDYFHIKQRVFPVGRLDFDTSGVLLLTNDGDFAHHMTHPKFEMEKEYHVKLTGLLRKDESKPLEHGLKTSDTTYQPATVSHVRYDKSKTHTYLDIVITEGQYHQIKRMFSEIGHEVVRLKRKRFGVVTIDGLSEGQYRRMKPHEVKQMWNLAKNGR